MKEPKSIYPIRTPKVHSTIRSRASVIPHIYEPGLDRVYRLDGIVVPKPQQIWNVPYGIHFWENYHQWFCGSAAYGINEVEVDVFHNDNTNIIGWQYRSDEGVGIIVDDLAYPVVDEFTAKITTGLDYRPQLWKGKLSEFKSKDVRNTNDS